MNPPPSERLARQINFLCEIDKVKSILRNTLLMDGSRQENDAEHAWHLALMVMVLSELAPKGKFDICKTLQMLLIHDIVEIDAGDAFLYDDVLRAERKALEAQSAERIFGLLPSDQAEEFSRLWDEFEKRQTPEAKFASALDRFQPILHNCKTEGRVWKERGVSAEQVRLKNAHIQEGAPLLWEYVQQLIEEMRGKGLLSND